MTTRTGVRGIDLDASRVISPPPVPTTAAPRIAPRLQVAIAGAIAGPIAGVMTEPDRLSTASAIAQTSAISAAAHPKPLSRAEHDRMANAIRALAMDAVEQAKSGHPGLPMGAADIATVLFARFLKFDPADPAWPDRDRFVLSERHLAAIFGADLVDHATFVLASDGDLMEGVSQEAIALAGRTQSLRVGSL
jgi:hypothetical protein